jgi:hypothetical protein
VTLWRSSSNWKNPVSAAAGARDGLASRSTLPKMGVGVGPVAAPTAARRTTPGSAPGGEVSLRMVLPAGPQIEHGLELGLIRDRFPQSVGH